MGFMTNDGKEAMHKKKLSFLITWILKQVQDDEWATTAGQGNEIHASYKANLTIYFLYKLSFSFNASILCHPELVSGSIVVCDKALK